MVKWIVVMKIQPRICLVNWEKPRKNPSGWSAPGIRTRDLPNASLVRYHGATSLGFSVLYLLFRRKIRQIKWTSVYVCVSACLRVFKCVCVCVYLCVCFCVFICLFVFMFMYRICYINHITFFIVICFDSSKKDNLSLLLLLLDSTCSNATCFTMSTSPIFIQLRKIRLCWTYYTGCLT